MSGRRRKGGVVYPEDYRIDPETGCWLWTLRCDPRRGGAPIMSVVGRLSNGMLARRELFMQERGLLTRNDVLVPTCATALCVNPDHVEVLARSEAQSRTLRERSRLSWEDVQMIRREAPWVLRRDHAERYGVDQSLVTLIVQNKIWFDPDYTPLLKKCAVPECDETFPAAAGRVCCSNEHNKLHSNRKARGYYSRRGQTDGGRARGPRGRAQPLDECYEVRPSGCWVWVGKLSDGRWPYMPYRGERSGSRSPRRELWVRAGNELPDGWRVSPTCGDNLCVNPAHAATSPGQSPSRKLTWEIVRAIRAEPVTTKASVLGRRYGVHPTTVDAIVRNETWHDPEYQPVNVRRCARPDCGTRFRSNRSNQKFCSTECDALYALRERSGHYEQQALAKNERSANKVARASLGWPVALDAPIGGDTETTASVFVADPSASDPFEATTTEQLRELLDGIDVSAVAAMGEDERAALRARLARAGFTPSVRREAIHA